MYLCRLHDTIFTLVRLTMFLITNLSRDFVLDLAISDEICWTECTLQTNQGNMPLTKPQRLNPNWILTSRALSSPCFSHMLVGDFGWYASHSSDQSGYSKACFSSCSQLINCVIPHVGLPPISLSFWYRTLLSTLPKLSQREPLTDPVHVIKLNILAFGLPKKCLPTRLLIV